MTTTAPPGAPTVANSASPYARLGAPWQLLLLFSLLALLYAQILSGLALNWWRDANYSHGFFVPLLSAYIIWSRRHSVVAQPLRPSWLGLPVVVVSVLLLLVARLGAELFVARTSFIGVLVGLVLYFLGWPALRILAFPLSLLFLMVPLPALIYNQIVFPLQLLASNLAANSLQFTQLVPVIREGNVLVLPSGSLEIVEACSGIRSLMSLVTLAVGYSYFSEKRSWVRLLLVLAMVPVAVVSNAIRVMCSALMTEHWGAGATEGTIHALSGLVLFLASVCMLLALHGVLQLALRLSGRAEEAA